MLFPGFEPLFRSRIMFPRQITPADRVVLGITPLEELLGAHSRYPSNRIRDAVFALQGHACLVCRSAVDLEIDHYIAWADGGLTTLENLQPLCRICNRAKGDVSGERGMQLARDAYSRILRALLGTTASR